MKRMIFAIIAGLFIVVIFSITTDTILEYTGFFPKEDAMAYNNSLLLIASLYRAVYGILGGYITAVMAKTDSLKAVWILGTIGTVLSLLGLIVMWNKGVLWYPVSLVVLSIPYSLIGRKFYLRRLAKKQPPVTS